MDKRKYVTPALRAVELQQKETICAVSGNNIDINNSHSEAPQLSNKNVWEDLW